MKTTRVRKGPTVNFGIRVALLCLPACLPACLPLSSRMSERSGVELLGWNTAQRHNSKWEEEYCQGTSALGGFTTANLFR